MVKVIVDAIEPERKLRRLYPLPPWPQRDIGFIGFTALQTAIAEARRQATGIAGDAWYPFGKVVSFNAGSGAGVK